MQTDKIVGLGAPEEVLADVTELTANHHPSLKVRP